MNGSNLFLNVQVKAYTTNSFQPKFCAYEVIYLNLLGRSLARILAASDDVAIWILLLRYSCQINGFSTLNLTKLDILSNMDEIQLRLSYKHEDGTPVKSFPLNLHPLKQLKVNIVFCSGMCNVVSQGSVILYFRWDMKRFLDGRMTFLPLGTIITVGWIHSQVGTTHINKRSKKIEKNI
jgi:hypothetical protein